jgi:pimeloyl-ACP methyl ester carboxylesterase
VPGTDPGLSALELNQVDAETIATVTPEHPLKLSVNTALGEGERVLAIAYDGEFFLPLGIAQTKGDKTEITLDRLPDPVSEGERSITGAIRIFFQKVVSEKLGLEFPYPILAAVNVNPEGTVDYVREQENVKAQVAKAKRIVLYIHGIIGDTESMVPSLRNAQITVNGQQEPLGNQYDLVLAFDYESLNTSIEAHARSLKQRLADVGLDRNHSKVLHIVAHSMGGLVSRWLIERESGNAIVNHLIMLGTPNAGSPWPTVQAWGTAALAIGLNSLSTIAWPVKVLGSLVAAIETIDTTLDQMQPGSDFLKSLAASPDPQTPYTILAGNTSIIPAVLDSNRLKRLMQKLMSDAVALPFFRQVNDIAVTVHSIKQVPEGRSPQPQIHEVGCDHLVYFSDLAGLQALSAAVSQAFANKE